MVRIALGQFNATVGDLAGNVAKMKKIWTQAMAAGADLVAFPEMAICGYPPEDLVYKKQFVQDYPCGLWRSWPPLVDRRPSSWVSSKAARTACTTPPR